MYNVVIIGSGCAGLTAAIYAARANLKALVLDGHEPGGQLSLTTHVENFPGFPDGIMGPEFIENMRKQAQKFGAEFKAGAVSEVDVSKRPFRIFSGKDTYETKALIVVAGASARLLGLHDEKESIRRGVFGDIGEEPETILFKRTLEVAFNGYLIAQRASLTSVPGVSIAGDVQDHR